MRSIEEKFLDLIFTLKAIELAQERGKKIGILPIQKIMFIASASFRKKNVRVLNQSFYRWSYGPMSNEVYEDISAARKSELIIGDQDISLTEHGIRVLEATSSIFKEDRTLTDPFVEIAEQFDDIDSIMDDVYSMDVYVEELDKEMPMSEIPDGFHILTPVWHDETSDMLKLSDEWRETLDVLLDPTLDKIVRAAMRDAKEGKFSPLELD